MAVPWLVVGKLVLNNLDTIIGVVKPAFTRKKVDALPSQTDLLNQQIAELQAAASSSAEQIKQLAAQLKEVVAALELAGTEAAAHRAATRKLSYVALSASAIAVTLSLVLAFAR
jgi:cytochrome P450